MKTILLLLALSCLAAIAQEAPEKKEKLTFKTKWKGERIDLPTEFAPKMKLKGIEEIRFAPGMFKPDSESFFSYVFVFAVPKDQKLTKEVLQKQTLVYYRGLATSVLGSKGKEVDTSKFTFSLEKSKTTTGTPAAVDEKKVTAYSGVLDWIEPFATAKAQKLHFELQVWEDTELGRNYVFVCTSPKAMSDKSAIWKEMREIRKAFTTK